MQAYLAYSYSTNLTDQEKIKVDARVEESRKDFSKGFKKGMKVSLSVYSIFLLMKSTAAAVHAVDVPPGPPGPPGTPGTPGSNIPGPVVPAVKPGMKPVTGKVRGMFIGAASTICGAFLQDGDFLIGLSCAFLLVTGAIILNRPHE
jgi:hypothetical protein